ncbi:hypothetical protein BGW37DRAFT_489730 [Umbelopsis sp. PMI_123]|nr:hypothetical protein BGW37DRAFT_489730 [Umbelopsis sp. PMI_123]
MDTLTQPPPLLKGGKEALESTSPPRSPPKLLHLQVSSIPMLLEPNPFVESAGQGYYAKSNSGSATENPHHAHPISTQEPPATPTPSAMEHHHLHHHVKYEPPSRRPQYQPVTTLKIPIPRRTEPPPSLDIGRPPHPSAVPASVQAQAALRRPAPIPKSSPPQPSQKGFHVVKYEKYEVKQERYHLHPSVKQNGSPPMPSRHVPLLPYNPPSEPSNHNNTHPASEEEEDEANSPSSDDENSDSSRTGSDGEDDSAPEDSDSSEDEAAVEAIIATPKNAKQNGKRKRATSGTGKINFKEEAGSSFIDKNAHIKRPRNAWIHFRCHYGQALKAQDPTLRTDEISKRASRRWAKLTDKQKKPWHDLAEQEKQAHKEAFPEYRYCPKRNAKKERQKYKRKNQLGTIMKP